MRSYKVYPNKIRGLGNVLDDVDVSRFEGVHGTVSAEQDTIVKNNVTLKMFKLELKGIPLVVSVSNEKDSISSGESTVLTVTLLADTGDGLKPVSGIDVYLYENGEKLYPAEETDSNGQVSFTFSSSVKGSHYLLIKSFSQKDYEASETAYNIYIYKDSALVLSVSPATPEILEDVTLTATLTDTVENKRVIGKTVHFYDGASELGTAVTDENGVATFIYTGGDSGTVLPSDYQQVEYIESDGTGQYIDLDYYPLYNSEVLLDAIYTPKSGTGSATYIYCSDDYNGSSRSKSFFIGNVNNSNTTDFYLLIDGTLKQGSFTGGGVRHTFHQHDGKLDIDDNTFITNTATYTGRATKTLWLIGGSERTSPNSFAKLRVYSMQIKEDGTLVRNLIPCYRKSDNEVGLYDIETGEFYPNLGTGSFTKGDNV